MFINFQPDNVTMRFLIATAMIAVCGVSRGQDFNHYKTLIPQAPIPRDFTEPSSVKVANEITSISNEKKRLQKTKRTFFLESTFKLDDFLSSGNVLFNDQVTAYVTSVFSKIAGHDKELQNVRVYTVKSPVVNAFTTNNGIIFVNLGLLARLENEAQLAFILAHEAIHFQKKHAISSYVTNIEMESRKGDYRKLSGDDRLFAKSSYAKDQEFEADLSGLDIFLKTSYAKDSLHKVFDILKLADFPLSWNTFNKKYFESGRYVFPDTFQINIDPKTFILKVSEDYDDSKSTHPNIKKRKDAVTAKLPSNTGGELFLVSKQKFEHIRKIAQYEVCRLNLLDHEYLRALALSMSLLEENPKSIYLKQTVAKALYGIAKDKLNKGFNYDLYEWVGKMKPMAVFAASQSSYEAAVLAIRYLYLCQEETPGNEELSLMVTDLIQALVEIDERFPEKFLRTPEASPMKDLPYPYTQYAFLDFKNRQTFFSEFDKQVSMVKNTPLERSKKSRKRSSANQANINRVVVVNPRYKKIDNRKKQKSRHKEAEEVMLAMDEKINLAAGKLNISTEVINPNNLRTSNAKVMQSNTILNDWIAENMLSGEDKRISPIYNEVAALASSYKTDHFVWMGAIAILHKKRGKMLYALTGVLVPSTIPLSVVNIAAPKGSTLYFALAFNVRTQKLEFADLRTMAMRDTRYLLQSNIYYTLFNLKKL
jgi:hypothetical protein